MPESISLIALDDLSFEWTSFGDYYDAETFALISAPAGCWYDQPCCEREQDQEEGRVKRRHQ